MVKPTIHAALTQLYFNDPDSHPPWNFSEWQAITSIKHGLFPHDDNLLPKGWTRETADFICSYFEQFKKKNGLDVKAAFASAKKNSNQKEATKAFEALSKEQPMKAKVKAVIIKTSCWKALVLMLHANEYLSAVKELDAQLQALMLQLSLDLNVSECLPKPAASQLTAMTVQSLASEKDISNIISLYVEFFNTPAPVDWYHFRSSIPPLGISLDEVERGDLGINVEVKMSPEALSTSLGFNHSIPIVFNAYQHRGSLSSWDPANVDLFIPAVAGMNPDMEPIKLHWHQAASVHAVL
ncbi:hypothetical protein CPB84DRAFT_1754275 [Gymnopilus junonius]|uniref:Uncharacterized protein n=1 Tax=Gymnopilus junonius TaxID=109634 RepID=A0A9P5TFE9_GYMJU|nr:hypothetical protein CPB84DRAFT_1754275 [Gymnopilus junonius]